MGHMDNQPQPELMNLSADQRKKLESSLGREIEASRLAKGNLPRRWGQNEDMYNLKEGTCRMQAVENMNAYEIPLLAPMVDRCVDAVVGTLTSLFPYVQCIDPGDNGQDPVNDENAEKLLHELAKSGGFIPVANKAVQYAALTNLGVTRITPDPKRGCKHEWVHPDKIICYPAEFGTFAEAKTVGHEYKMLLYRIKERQKAGEFYKDVTIKAEGNTESAEELEKRTFNLTEQTDPVTPEDSPIELACVLHHCDLDGEGEYKWYECVYAITAQRLLSCKPYLYSQPNYFDWRFQDPQGEIYTGWSLAQQLAGLQLAYSDIWTVFIQGTFATAFPTVYQIGGVGPLQVSHYGPATRIQVSEDVKIQVVSSGMRDQSIPTMIKGLEERASAISGISQLGTSANLPSGTTATAAAGFLQAQQEAKNRYAQAVAPTIARMWEFMYELYQMHTDDINMALGSRATPFVPDKQYSFEVTGESGASNPQMIVQKLQMLQQMAMAPGAQFDLNKVTDKIVQMFEFPFPASALKKDGPSADEMKAIFMGVVMGELQPQEALGMMGITPEMMQQFMQTHQQLHGPTSEQGPNGAILPQPGMADGGGAPPEPPMGATPPTGIGGM